jgi:hypothetical protein
MSWSGLPKIVERYIVPEPNSGCWFWLGNANQKGYGMISRQPGGVRSTMMAHRFIYKILRDDIAEGLQLDHLCRTPCCVNPDHLEPVTPGENSRRGNTGIYGRSKTYCPAGHAYDVINTAYSLRKDGGRNRYCKECKRLKTRARRSAGTHV